MIFVCSINTWGITRLPINRFYSFERKNISFACLCARMRNSIVLTNPPHIAPTFKTQIYTLSIPQSPQTYLDVLTFFRPLISIFSPFSDHWFRFIHLFPTIDFDLFTFFNHWFQIMYLFPTIDFDLFTFFNHWLEIYFPFSDHWFRFIYVFPTIDFDLFTFF